ncbi:hypothetical protein [Pseudonocardia broussonetiae]|uniref:PE family protein n=1 Tax=Pseudonocardia broussonetiae TaxID=2736640 RepID=A0A6M6JJ55_9PSEU|nr:hypothetical protein [Pseudonocardia broussonetiae]QJY46947.1 hypothetical protein HOP40_14905 [Pseudonocardia broussonetiae]
MTVSDPSGSGQAPPAVEQTPAATTVVSALRAQAAQLRRAVEHIAAQPIDEPSPVMASIGVTVETRLRERASFVGGLEAAASQLDDEATRTERYGLR